MDNYNFGYTSKYILSDRDKKILNNWILTGFKSNNYNQYKNKADDINYKLILKNPIFTKQVLLKASKIGINKQSQIKALSFLTIGNFKTKKIFKDLFPIIIQNFDDLYFFMETVKEIRGFGSVITNTICSWIKSKSFNFLQNQLINYPKNYNWSFKDILNMIHPTPRSDIEETIFNYCMSEDKKKINVDNLQLLKYYEQIKNGINIEENIKKIKISNKSFPGNVEKTDLIWKSLIENMSAKEILKNINFLSKKKDLLKDNFLKNRISSSNINQFYLSSIINKIEDSILKNGLKEIILSRKNKINKKISMFIDTDLEFSGINGVSGVLYPYLFSLGNDFNIVNFFKNKFIKVEDIDYSSLIGIDFQNRENSYSNIFIKNIIDNLNDEEIVIVWAGNKKIILRDADIEKIKDKKLIIISTNQTNFINVNYRNVYMLQGISYKTIDLIKLIVEDII